MDEGYGQTRDELTFKIYIKDDSLSPKQILLEITTENDVEFFYNLVVAYHDFENIKFENHLSDNVVFAEPESCMKGSKTTLFEDMVKNLLQESRNDPKTYKAHFTLDDTEGNAFFHFFHDTDYGESEILWLRFR